jgi:HEAT repeat protein
VGRTPILAAAALAAAILVFTCTGVAWMLSPSRPAEFSPAGSGGSEPASEDDEPAEATRGSAGSTDPAAFPCLAAETPAQVRQVVRYAREAEASAIDELRAAAGAEDPLVAGNALRALGRLGELDGVRYLDDPRLRVRQEAVVSLGLSGKTEAVAHLERALSSCEPEVRPLAIQALGRISAPEARSLLEGWLATPDASEVERAFARQALSAAGP